MQKTGKPTQQATPVQPNVQSKARAQKVNHVPPSGESSSGSESDNSVDSDDSDASSDTSDDEEMTERVNSVVAMVQGVKHNLQASQGVTSKVTTPPGSQSNKSQNHSRLNSNTVQNKGNQNLVKKGAIKRKASDSSSSESSSDSDSGSDSSDDSGDESNKNKPVKSLSGKNSEDNSAKSAPKPVLKPGGFRNILNVEGAKVLTPLRNRPAHSQNNIQPPSTPMSNQPFETLDKGPTPKSSTPANTNKQTPGGSETKTKRKRKRTRKRNRNKGTPGTLHSKTMIEQT